MLLYEPTKYLWLVFPCVKDATFPVSLPLFLRCWPEPPALWVSLLSLEPSVWWDSTDRQWGSLHAGNPNSLVAAFPYFYSLSLDS